MRHKHIYGPVPSRRLGFSLGIDLVPFKNCSFNCIYCQLGKTTNHTTVRREYMPVDEILEDVKTALREDNKIDYLTFSGSGEPTLHSKIGYLIKEVKKITEIPIAVLTNGSLLYETDVQEALIYADVVLPTLCAVTPEVFKKINRPHTNITIENVIQGLLNFRKVYNGKIWLEIMLVKDINDTLGEITKLKEIVKKINPDKIHLNTVVRPPSEKFATPVPYSKLIEIKAAFGYNCEIIVDFQTKRQASHITDVKTKILDLIKRRPVTQDDLAKVTGLHKNEIIKYLDQLSKDRKIKLTEHHGRNYYEAL